MTDAIFPLIGVIIGGLLTAGVDALERRATNRRAERLAARVLYDELANLKASARQSIKTERPELLFGEKIELSAVWREHRNDLAGIDWDVWIAVDHAVASLETTTTAEEWSDERKGWLSVLDADATRALAALAPLIR